MCADYALSPDGVDKRVRFYDGQFLKDQDFIDEQKYHLDRQRRFARFLSVAGICQGLTLDTSKSGQITVKPGTAIDSEGRQLVLVEDQVVSSNTYFSKQVEVVITYGEVESDPSGNEALGGQGNRRFQEKPVINIRDVSSGIGTDGKGVVLGKLTIDGQGNITRPDDNVLQYSGLQLPAKDGNGVTLTSQNGASDRAILTGSLSITGNVGIGITTPSAKLEVAQNGTGNAAYFKGGAQLTGAALAVEHNSANNIANVAWFKAGEKTIAPALWVEQNGTGNAAYFKAGEKTTSPALYVTQKGTGRSAYFEGGSGVEIQKDLYVGGKVGIGTTNPSQKLEVSGNLKVTGSIVPSTGNAETNGIMFPKDPGGGSDDAAWIRYYPRTGENCTLEIGINNDADDHIALMPNNGNVGIGTSDPKAKLHIQGAIAITNFSASNADAANQLGPMPNGTCLMGAVLNERIFFYWKGGNGTLYAIAFTGRSGSDFWTT